MEMERWQYGRHLLKCNCPWVRARDSTLLLMAADVVVAVVVVSHTTDNWPFMRPRSLSLAISQFSSSLPKLSTLMSLNLFLCICPFFRLAVLLFLLCLWPGNFFLWDHNTKTQQECCGDIIDKTYIGFLKAHSIRMNDNNTHRRQRDRHLNTPNARNNNNSNNNKRNAHKGEKTSLPREAKQTSTEIMPAVALVVPKALVPPMIFCWSKQADDWQQRQANVWRSLFN